MSQLLIMSEMNGQLITPVNMFTSIFFCYKKVRLKLYDSYHEKTCFVYVKKQRH